MRAAAGAAADERSQTVICGHCKTTGTTVAHVRECSRQETAATGSVRPSEPLHDAPCVCGPYDLCKGVRREHAAGASTQGEYLRRLHWAYND